ncbi:MAG: Rhodanese domain protein [Rhodospirillales bacterium]|nr:Rhodanese domain protein [Rhodospirillales bacterium]
MFAAPCPYSRLELLAPALVPNPRVPVLLIDGGDGAADRAARRLDAMRYERIAVLSGGIGGWEAAGFTLYKGVNVPSKTLGELAEAVWHPATVDAATLARWRAEGRAFRLFDARPPAEHRKMTVPGAVCLPNGELAHRFAAAVGDSETPVVVHCAGRTRGLVGAIGLRLAGIENPVFALENGTQGWALAGQALDRGRGADPFPALAAADLDAARARAIRFSAEWDIPGLGAEELQALAADDGRTHYLLDVRSEEEYARSHAAGAVHAPAGQLVQATDQWVGVRRARLALIDDAGLRAAIAGFWLRQLGYEPYVVPLAEAERAKLPSRQAPAFVPRGLEAISADAAAAGLEAGTHLLLDLRSSAAHRAGHPKDARWAIRPRLRNVVAGWEAIPVLLAAEPMLAALAAIDLEELGCPVPMLLEGGAEAWRAAGLPWTATADRPSPEEAIDFLQFVHDRHDGNLEASRRYLAWEQGLVAQLDAEERDEFRLERPSAR